MTVTDLLAAVRAAHSLPSNYALARFLDVRETTLWRWTSGRNAPDDATAARLAELAGLDPDSVVAAMHAARAHEPAERARWERIAQRLARAGAVAAAVILSVWTTGDPDGGALLESVAASGLWIADLTAYTLGTVLAALALHSRRPRFIEAAGCR